MIRKLLYVLWLASLNFISTYSPIFSSFFILEVSTYKKNRLREGVVLLRQSSGWSLNVTRIKLLRVGRQNAVFVRRLRRNLHLFINYLVAVGIFVLMII